MGSRLSSESVVDAALASCCAAARAECNLSASKIATLERRAALRGKRPIADHLPIVNKHSVLCRRLILRIAFDGTDFHGWMRQPGLRTLQQVLEDALRTLLGQRVRVVPAGRTDAGVHALSQVCQFDAVLGDLSPDDLCHILNERLPSDLYVHEAAIVDTNFNVMVTSWKRYVYRISNSAVLGEMPLDLQRMQEAAELLVGTHDFAAFQSARGRQTTVRTVYRCEVAPRGGFGCVSIIMEADGFLPHVPHPRWHFNGSRTSQT